MTKANTRNETDQPPGWFFVILSSNKLYKICGTTFYYTYHILLFTSGVF